MKLESASIDDLSRVLASRELSATELTTHFLNRIDARSDLNAFISVEHDLALESAAEADRRLRAGDQAPLLGIPIAEKDLFCTTGGLTTAASKMLANYHSPFDSTVSLNLKQAGAVRLGKCNLDEFAMGSSNENSYFGPVKNPWDTKRVPGGSSGGSAAAVVAGLCTAATGTDTGGSIRQPAAFCGLTGLKPTYGRISRWGMIAFASSLDQAGPMTRSAADAASLLEVMAGSDHQDSTSLPEPVPPYRQLITQSIKDAQSVLFPRS